MPKSLEPIMFGSSILEVAIGLVSIYLFVSVMATAANEMIANFLNSRGKCLWNGISAMLETATQVKQIAECPPSRIQSAWATGEEGFGSSVWRQLWNTFRATLGSPSAATHAGKSWTNKLYEHPMIRALFPLEAQGNEAVSGPKGRGPSYIPPRRFAMALLDITGIWDPKIKELQSEFQRRLDEIPAATGTGEQIIQAIESVRTGLGQLQKKLGSERTGSS